ncbi:hypothetical protein DSUL_50251 [Desulfovibrionales bacterium]
MTTPTAQNETTSKAPLTISRKIYSLGQFGQPNFRQVAILSLNKLVRRNIYFTDVYAPPCSAHETNPQRKNMPYIWIDLMPQNDVPMSCLHEFATQELPALTEESASYCLLSKKNRLRTSLKP